MLITQVVMLTRPDSVDEDCGWDRWNQLLWLLLLDITQCGALFYSLVPQKILEINAQCMKMGQQKKIRK